jgi:hypothetical protein
MYIYGIFMSQEYIPSFLSFRKPKQNSSLSFPDKAEYFFSCLIG